MPYKLNLPATKPALSTLVAGALRGTVKSPAEVRQALIDPNLIRDVVEALGWQVYRGRPPSDLPQSGMAGQAYQKERNEISHMMISAANDSRFRRWTEQDDIDVLESNVPLMEIAKKIGRTLNAVTLRRAMLRKRERVGPTNE